MTKTYTEANEAYNVAIRIFSKAQANYRARVTGDAEFLAARKAFAEATAIFDVAYAAEEAIDEAAACDATVENVDGRQLALL